MFEPQALLDTFYFFTSTLNLALYKFALLFFVLVLHTHQSHRPMLMKVIEKSKPPCLKK